MGRYLVRPVVRLFRSRKLGAIEVEHEQPNGRFSHETVGARLARRVK